MYQVTIELFAADIYRYVFEILDDHFSEHEMTGIDAGRIATITEKAFRAALNEHFSDSSVPDEADVDEV